MGRAYRSPATVYLERMCIVLLFWLLAVGATATERSSAQRCAIKAVTDPTPPKSAIFDELQFSEVLDVAQFMIDEYDFIFPSGWSMEQGAAYDLAPVTPTPKDNYIYRIEVIPVEKAAAMGYLDGNAPAPPRYARVIVLRGAANPRDVMEYKVGPLPLVHGSVEVTPLFNDGDIPYLRRPEDSYEWDWLSTSASKGALTLKKIFLNMTGGRYCYGEESGTDEDGVQCGYDYWFTISNPSLTEDNGHNRIHFLQFNFMPENLGGSETFLHTLPLSWKIDASSPEIDEWKPFDFEYCHQGPFGSPEALLEAFHSGSLVVCNAPEWSDPNYTGDWARTDVANKHPRPGSTTPGPRLYTPGGARFSLSGNSQTGRRFSWLGWEGHITFTSWTGIKLYDVTFDGDRIAYELSLQEMYVAYSGYGQRSTVYYYDSMYGIGSWTMALRPGVDCPETAEYMSVVVKDFGGNYNVVNKAICMFEDDLGTTSWRHTHTPFGSAEAKNNGLRATDFVIRFVAPVGNYDYVYDVRFQLDGSIKIEMQMAGYMSTAFWSPIGQTKKDIPFGTRVHKYTFANLHDHLTNWKVDLDILGVNNTFVRHYVKSGTYADIGLPTPGWSDPPHVHKYVTDEVMETETYLKLNYEEPNIWQFQSKQHNAWGKTRGYAIVHGFTSSQLLPNDHPQVKSAAWTKGHLAVSIRKESEQNAHQSLYSFHSCKNPVWSLDDAVNGEFIEDKDLVGWVTMGAQHIPRSEDIPLIANVGMSFSIKPWNYFDGLRSMDVVDNLDFESCIPTGGKDFDYSWSPDGTSQEASAKTV